MNSSWKPSRHTVMAAHMADNLARITKTNPADWYWCMRWMNKEDWQLIRIAWQNKDLIHALIRKRGIPTTPDELKKFFKRIKQFEELLGDAAMSGKLQKFIKLNPGVLPDEAEELILKPILRMPKRLQKKWLPLLTKVPALATKDNPTETIKNISGELAKEVANKINPEPTLDDYLWLKEKCKELDITPPKFTENWAYRAKTARWWEIKLRRQHLRKWTNIERDAGLVNNYIGKRTLKMVTDHTANGTIWLHDKFIEKKQDQVLFTSPTSVTPPFNDEPEWTTTPGNNKEEEKLPLAAIAAKAKQSRQALNAARLHYLQKLMDDKDNAVALVTLTVPGAFRPGKDDPRSIEECRKYITQTCNRVSARIAKLRKNKDSEDVFMVGIKCFQPHKDGTPHAHLIVVTQKKYIKTIEKLWREQILKEHPDEPGSAQYRLDFAIVKDDEDRKKAISYASRYTSRLTQSKIHEINSQSPEEIKQKIAEILEQARENAWYRATGTRRFSWFGLPPAYWWMSISKQVARDWRNHCPLVKDKETGKLIP